MMVTLADLTARRARPNVVAAFNALALTGAWTQAETDRCLSLVGGPELLTFLEYYGLVPVLQSDPARFKHPQTKALRVALARYIGPDGFARVPGLASLAAT
jgi:hypothetical protein